MSGCLAAKNDGFTSRDDGQRASLTQHGHDYSTIQIPVSSGAMVLQGMGKWHPLPRIIPPVRQHRNAGFRQILLRITQVTAMFPRFVLKHLSIQGPLSFNRLWGRGGGVRGGGTLNPSFGLLFFFSLCFAPQRYVIALFAFSRSLRISELWRQAIEMRYC